MNVARFYVQFSKCDHSTCLNHWMSNVTFKKVFSFVLKSMLKLKYIIFNTCKISCQSDQNYGSYSNFSIIKKNKFTTFLFMGRFPKIKRQNKQNYAYLYAM